MKKTYMTPAMQVEMTQAQHMMAVSLQGGNADRNKDVLIKEDVDWDMWSKE